MENYLTQIKNIVSKSQANKVYILGKGPSLSNINKNILKEGIVININDSERFYAGDFCLVHSLWAHESIKQNGAIAKSYISSRSSIIKKKSNWIQVKYQPNIDNFYIENINDFNDEFFLTDFLFISALKLSLDIQKILSKKLKIYFLGFDFLKNSLNVIKDFSNHKPEYTDIVLKTQESIFKNLKHNFKKSKNVKLIHVGSKYYSDISLDSFNSPSNKLTKLNISGYNRLLYKNLVDGLKDNIPIVVAELTNNHIGNENRLKSMIKLAKAAGANAIKVQKRDVDTFYSSTQLNSYYDSPFGSTLGEYRKAVELDDKLFNIIVEECAKHDIFWFSTILDIKSFEYLKKYDLPLIKLPSTVSNHKNFLKYVSKKHKGDIVISTGFTDQKYESFILDNFSKERNLFLLQCTSSYPTPPESCNVSVVRHYNNLKFNGYPNIIPGYSSHDVGSLASMMSISAGSLMIEKHVKLGDLDWVHFDGVALDLLTDSFRNFVQDLKVAKTISGNQKKSISLVEHHKYKTNKQSN